MHLYALKHVLDTEFSLWFKSLFLKWQVQNVTNQLINSRKQSPSWEAKRSLASQEIPPNFMEPTGSLPYSQQPATCPYRVPDESSPCPPPPPTPHSFS
jgi:hypothetical protein